MNRIYIFTLLFVMIASNLISQNTKKLLSHSDYDNWKSIEKSLISDDGKWVSYERNPQKGDGWLFILCPDKNFIDSIPRGCNAKFSPNSDFIVFKIEPQEDTLRKAKLKKKKGDDLPKDTLAIYVFKKDTLIKFGRVKSFSVPEKEQSLIAFLYEKNIDKPKKDSTSTKKDTTNINNDTLKTVVKTSKKDKAKKKKKAEGTEFVIYNPLTNENFKYENITDYDISKNGNLICYLSLKSDSIDSATVYTFNTKSKQSSMIYNDKGIAKKIVVDNKGAQCAFILTQDTTENKTYSLYFWNNTNKDSFKIIDTLTKEIPKDWSVSENGTINFSDDDSKLYFNTAHKPRKVVKDTILDEEKSRVDIWNWQDHRLQSQQINSLSKDKKKSYTAVYHINTKAIVQLADTIIDRVGFIKKGNANTAFAGTTYPYDIINAWDPEYKDYYLIDMLTGTKKLILQKKKFSVNLSPDGKYILWFDTDSAWHIINLKTGIKSNLTKGLKVNFYDEIYDESDIPDSYGIAGWTENDKNVFIYDRYDIWKFDPEGKEKPLTITNNKGRKTKTQLRYLNLDKEALFIDSKKDLFIRGFNEINKQDSYHKINISKKDTLHKLFAGEYMLSTPKKAKDADRILWAKSSFTLYPDINYSDINIKNNKVISNVNPQINQYNWGTVELVKWTTFNGNQLEGLVYKPENFDSTKKYPMIVYFYDRSSDTYFQHMSPRPSRSVINFPLYVSNGYIIFVPDIVYKKGHPGKDCYDAVISGTEFMLKRSYIDRKKLGLQGQSWGGYQVAYLVTQTNLYTAAMAGAPVSNMTSAYGGIRWESGLSRVMQYEKGQSRIGGTLWDNLDLYIENSPLFSANKIKTPLLIMSNDNDGAVPWQQGIEMFNAMRRLQKPAWMLTYNDDEHNLMKRPNCVDLSIRMMQFFDTYLKDKPAPVWMSIGIPALEKEFNKGYQLEK